LAVALSAALLQATGSGLQRKASAAEPPTSNASDASGPTKRQSTEATIDQLVHQLRRPFAKMAPPTALQQVRGQVSVNDGWGQPIQFEVLDGAVHVLSLGADGKRGGQGDDTDVERWIPCHTSCPAFPLHRAIPRSDFIQLLTTPSASDRQVRLVPTRDDSSDKIAGVQVFGIRSGQAVDRLGFCNGDEIQEIDGVPVATMLSQDEAMKLFERLHHAERIVLRIRRNEVVGNLTIVVQ
jgi:hypothetical protein